MRGFLIFIVLLAMVGVGWLVFPAAKDLASRSLALRAAERAAEQHQWVEVQGQLEAIADTHPTDKEVNLLFAEALTHTEARTSATENHVTETSAPNAELPAAQRVYARLWQAHTGDLAIGTGYAKYLARREATRPLALSVLRDLLAKHPKHTDVLLALAEVYRQAALQQTPHAYPVAMAAWLNQWAAYYTDAAIPLIQPKETQFTPRYRVAQLHQLLAQQAASLQNQPAPPAEESGFVDSPSASPAPLADQSRSAAPVMREDSHTHLALAARQYCNALLLQPRHVGARFNLGLTLMNLQAVEAGVTQLRTAIDLLMADGRVKRAQVLSEEAQRVKTSLYYSDPASHRTPEEINDLLGQCLTDPRLAIDTIAKDDAKAETDATKNTEAEAASD